MVYLPEDCKIVTAIDPVSTNSAQTGDTVSLKNSNKAWVLLNFTQAAADTTTITIYESDDVSGSNTSAITETHKIWANSDTSSSDTLTAQTDAATYSLANTTKNQQVLIEVDPSLLSDGYPCIYVYTAASGEASDYVSAVYILDMAYKEDVPPAAITD